MTRAAVAGLVFIFLALAAVCFAHNYHDWVAIGTTHRGLWKYYEDTGSGETYHNTSWENVEPVITKGLAIAGTAFLVFALIFVNIHLCKKNRHCGIAAAVFCLLGALFLCGCAGYFLYWVWDDRSGVSIGFYVMCGAAGLGIVSTIFLVMNVYKSDNKIRQSDTKTKVKKIGRKDKTPRKSKSDLTPRKNTNKSKNK